MNWINSAIVPIIMPTIITMRTTLTPIAHDSLANVNGNIRKIIIPTIIEIIFNPTCNR